MDEQLFQTKLNELLQRINGMSNEDRNCVADLTDDATQRQSRIRNSVGELQDALDHLRLTVKYLVFDLEATRRENAYLRSLLDQANQVEDADADDEVADGEF